LADADADALGLQVNCAIDGGDGVLPHGGELAIMQDGSGPGNQTNSG
jgi:hypothetical protein